MDWLPIGTYNFYLYFYPKLTNSFFSPFFYSFTSRDQDAGSSGDEEEEEEMLQLDQKEVKAAPASKKQKGLKDSLASSLLKKRKMLIESSDSEDSAAVAPAGPATGESGDEVAESMRKPKPSVVSKKAKKAKGSPTASASGSRHKTTVAEPLRTSSRQARIENNLMSELLNRIYKMPAAVYFFFPVDPVELEIPDYFDIIEKPMDLGTVKQKLKDLSYEDAVVAHEAFAADMRLTFVNAYTYNHQEDNPVHIAGKELLAVFEKEFSRLVATITAQREEALAAAMEPLVQNHKDKGSSGKRSKSRQFTEAESDDEFAIQNFTYTEEELKKKKGKDKGKGAKAPKASENGRKKQDLDEEAEMMDEVDDEGAFSASESGSAASDSDADGSDDGFEYRVQHVLATKTMTPAEWRDVCGHMNTREITRGSAWKQPDEEYYDNSSYVVTKYLVKWMHASYLHVSWETEKDLNDCVGATAKTQLKKFHIRVALGQELFEDLIRGEFFLPAFTCVERVLDVEDPRVDMQKVDWANAPLPEFDPFATTENSDDEDEADGEEAEDQMEVIEMHLPSHGAHRVQDGEQYITGNDDDMPLQMEHLGGEESMHSIGMESMHAGVIDLRGDDELLDLELSNSHVSAPAGAFKAASKHSLLSSVGGLDAFESPSKFDKSQLNEMLGVTCDVASPADLAAITMDEDEDAQAEDNIYDEVLFDSDEEREITERIRAQAEQTEPDNCESTKMHRRSGRAHKPVERLIEEDKEEDEEAPKRITRGGDKGKKKPDAKAAEAKKAKAFKALLASEEPCTDLHGSGKGTIWVTVKWEGLAYSDASFEDLRDLQRMYIDYEAPMRAFFKREQLSPTKGTTRVKRSLNADAMEAVNGPPLPGTLELRDYQWEGVRWLLFNWSQRRNSILADEMGLGKTIQTAVFLQMLHKEQGMRGPFLIVAPLSTITQWQREISLWTEMDAIIYHGSVEDREVIRNHEFMYMSRKQNEGTKLQVVITTPETCMSADSKTPTARVRRELCKIKWDLVVVDEAHKLKNYDSKVGSVLRDDFDYLNCLLLTGTPLQNNTDELWTLLNFVNRDEFSDREQFCEEFGSLREAEQLQRLHVKLKPYLLRREKEHVEKKVPPKEEIIVEVELTAPQKQYYRAIYEQKTGFLYKGGAKDGPSLSNLAMELRKCCNHPFLIKGAETELSKHFEGKTPLEQLVQSSGKMMLLDKLLPKLRDDGHRVLIFSQFRIMLNLIEDYMIMRGYSFERVDGAITGRKRQNAIDRYTTGGEEGKPEIFAMLLSTRAGGVGINLTAADTVIIFDSDWNPQNDIQAQARAHRIGQTKKVKVYRFITRKSYETAMFQAASIKLGLDYAVMGGMKPKAMAGITGKEADNFSSLSKKELENLLKHGAYDIFNEEKDGTGTHASQQFMDEDIDEILKRSAVVVHGSKIDENGEAKDKASASFSKASFVTGSGADDVAIDDPDFWSKVVGLAEGATAEETSNRGRRCRDHVDSYKEPGMTFTVFESDSESDSDVEGPQRKQKQDFDLPAEYTERNMTRLLQALCDKGYGNWGAVRASTKLRWSHKDLARASRAIVLQLICWASLDNDYNGRHWSGQRCPEGLKKAQWGFEDLQYIEEFLARHRASRLALAAMKEDARTTSSNTHPITSMEALYDACVANPLAVYFRKAVDPIALDIPDYFDIVKKPMDMGLIKQNMQRGNYEGDHKSFAAHMRLTFCNAYTYNHMEENPVHIAARNMEAFFDAKYAAYIAFVESKPAEDILLARAFAHCAEVAEDQQDLFDFFDNAGFFLGAPSLLFGDDDVTPVVLSREDLAQLRDEDERTQAREVAAADNLHKQTLRLARIREMVVSARTSPVLKEFDLWEAGKNNALRTQARGKLQAIENLFECHVMATVANGTRWATPVTSTTTADVEEEKVVELVAMEMDAPVNEQSEEQIAASAEVAASTAAATAQVNAVAASDARIAIAARLRECKPLEPADVHGWDFIHDAWLLQAVNSVGWPEGKRKQAALQARWEDFLKNNTSAHATPAEASGVVVTEATPADAENADTEPVLSTEPVVLGIGGFPEDIIRGKFLVRRCKEIGVAMRGGSEAALAAAAKAAEKAEAALQKATIAAEKAAAKAAKSAAQLPKQVFAAIQRVGRVHTEYEELLVKLPAAADAAAGAIEEEVMEVSADGEAISTPASQPMPGSAGRRTFILTWEALALETGMQRDSDGSFDISQLKSIVDAIVTTAYAPIDPTSAGQEVTTEGHALAGSGLTPKALLAGMEKVDAIHRLRLACVCLDTSGIRAGVLATCKQAGPLVGPSRRDTSLPAWWTVENDLRLMRLCFSGSFGYGQWKKICADKAVADAPADFVMPSKIQGFDWVTTLTPKVCEKRLQALASGLARHMSSLASGAAGYIPPPPGSPERRKPGPGSATSKKSNPSTTFTSSAPTAPLITKLENYQRPSWINTFTAGKEAPKPAESAFAGAAKLRTILTNAAAATIATATAPSAAFPATPAVSVATTTAGNGANGMTVIPMAGLSPVDSPAKARRSSDVPPAAVKPKPASPAQDSSYLQAVKLMPVTLVTAEKPPKPVVATISSAPLDVALAADKRKALVAEIDVVELDDDGEMEVVDMSGDHVTPFKPASIGSQVTPTADSGPEAADMNSSSGEKRKADGSEKTAKVKKPRKEKEPKEKKEKIVKEKKEKEVKKAPILGNIMNFFGAPAATPAAAPAASN